MLSKLPSKFSSTPLSDLLLIVFLVGFDVLARLLVHVPNFTPVLASALFAGTALRTRPLALVVPIAAMLISDAVIGFDDWRIMSVVYVALLLPSLVGIFARRFRVSTMLVPAALSCSLIFFVATNFAVWAFGSIYSTDLQGLVQCYIAALPFLQYTLLGDLTWAAIFFGGAWLVQTTFARARLLSGVA